jgi:hypothetical protein
VLPAISLPGSAPDPITRDRFLAVIADLSRQLPAGAFVFNLSRDPLHYLFGFYAAVLAGQCTLMPSNRLKSTIEEIREEYRTVTPSVTAARAISILATRSGGVFRPSW